MAMYVVSGIAQWGTVSSFVLQRNHAFVCVYKVKLFYKV